MRCCRWRVNAVSVCVARRVGRRPILRRRSAWTPCCCNAWGGWPIRPRLRRRHGPECLKDAARGSWRESTGGTSIWCVPPCCPPCRGADAGWRGCRSSMCCRLLRRCSAWVSAPCCVRGSWTARTAWTEPSAWTAPSAETVRPRHGTTMAAPPVLRGGTAIASMSPVRPERLVHVPAANRPLTHPRVHCASGMGSGHCWSDWSPSSWPSP